MGTYAEVESLLLRGLQETAPAIQLAVFYRGDLLVERAYGYLDPDTQQHPIHTETLFDLASVTKLFTMTTFLLQVADGKIGLDDPVVRVLPEFGQSGARPIEGGQDPHTLQREPTMTTGTVDPARVTFRHLLTHTSGLAPWRDLFLNVGPTPPPPGTTPGVPHRERLARALDLIAAYPFVNQPGAEVLYSDLGLILLGAAVARLDGFETLEHALHHRLDILPAPIFCPPLAGFPAELCAPTEDDQRWRKRRCQGEVHDENACALGGIAGHAGLFGSAHLVAQLGLFWIDALKGGEELPLPLAQEAIRNHADYRGLGWILRVPEISSAGAHFSPESFGHTGFTGTSLWIDPRRELIVSLMTNRVYLGRDHDGIIAFRRAVHDAVAQWVDALG